VSGSSISVVVAAYNAERHIGETLAAIVGQSSPPDEVIVVDDGSTDGTLDVIRGFGSDVRVVRQANSSAAGAYNRGFAEARSTYVARCDADDVWEPTKLERQRAALAAHPEVDLAIGAAWIFGREDRLFAEAPGVGVLDSAAFAARMFDWNIVCSSTAVLRRELVQRLGPLVDGLVAEDYEYWMRALEARATFYYDAELLVRYRQHAHNVTNNVLRMAEATHRVHRRYVALAGDPRSASRVLARDLRTVGRLLVDDDPAAARRAFVASLREYPTAEGAVWAAVLSAPPRPRGALVRTSLTVKRGLVARLQGAR
jgi:glycosyltransferase involved in cell wall biosynthesis